MSRSSKKKKARLQGAHALAASDPAIASRAAVDSKSVKKTEAIGVYQKPWSKRSIWICIGFGLLLMAVVGLADGLRLAGTGKYPWLAVPIDSLGTALLSGGLGILIVAWPIRRILNESRRLRVIEVLALAIAWTAVSILFASSIAVAMPANPLLAPQPNYVTAFLFANLICAWITNFIYRHLPSSVYGKA